jgi:uncharacterized protein YndB with AHSA1/START domain
MTDWIEFWPRCNNVGKGKCYEQDDAEHGRHRAHTDPKLIQQWLLGPEGWTMPVCINEARPGGKIRYEWTNGKGGGFHLTGEYPELEPYNRIVHVERMHLPDPTPDNHVETRFDAEGTGTLMTMRMTLPDAQTRAAMIATRHGTRNGSELCAARRNALASPRGPHPGTGVQCLSADAYCCSKIGVVY